MFRRVLIVLILLTGIVRAGPDDDFVEIYQLIQATDAQRENGRFRDARDGYTRAQELLQKLKKEYPDWNERVVVYRLRYVAESCPNFRLPCPMPSRPRRIACPGERRPDRSGAGEVVTQFRNLHTEISQLKTEKQKLEARLREALTAQPVPVDPKELQAAVERITQLQATNRMLSERIQVQQAERQNLVDKVLLDEAEEALNPPTANWRTRTRRPSVLKSCTSARRRSWNACAQGTSPSFRQRIPPLKSQVTELTSATDRGDQIANLAERVSKLQEGLRRPARAMRHSWPNGPSWNGTRESPARQSEEGIVRLKQLETDLAFARAEGQRQTVRAVQLEEQLGREKGIRGTLEQSNLPLQPCGGTHRQGRWPQGRGAAAPVGKEERAELEAQLHAAEQQLQVARTTRAGTDGTVTAAPADPLAEAKPGTGGGGAALAGRTPAEPDPPSRTAHPRRRGRQILAAGSVNARNSDHNSDAQKAPAQQQLAAANRSVATLEERVRRLEKERDTLSPSGSTKPPASRRRSFRPCAGCAWVRA